MRVHVYTHRVHGKRREGAKGRDDNVRNVGNTDTCGLVCFEKHISIKTSKLVVIFNFNKRALINLNIILLFLYIRTQTLVPDRQNY